MTNRKTSPLIDRVAILLCTMNGQRFLGEQLDSIAAQTMPDWRLWASDDGSHDGTLAILDHYRAQWGEDRLARVSGPKKGYVANFLSLICRAEIEAEYYAFADQDDIWESDKLARALAWLDTVPCGTPALYCSRTRLIDQEGRPVGLSPLFAKPPHFANALVQNIAGGNTMIFNNAARALLREAGGEVTAVIHDWWAYLVVTGCGGTVYYDPQPTVRYRLHDGNLVGDYDGLRVRLGRTWRKIQGQSREWNSRNLQALRGIVHLLTPDSRRLLELWGHSRTQGLPSRLTGFIRTGIYRQSLFDNIGLLVAVLFGRV